MKKIKEVLENKKVRLRMDLIQFLRMEVGISEEQALVIIEDDEAFEGLLAKFEGYLREVDEIRDMLRYAIDSLDLGKEEK